MQQQLGNWESSSLLYIYNCLAGDELEAWGLHDAGVDTPDIYGSYDPAWTWFSIALIE
ncbi:unnamed protein product [marine sediment metagenome]|uniref:Uncharacterized protein n=1 Tax=marine sediment metagenome TaxID=412755 RepID=X1NNA5_9ZZZZ